MALKELPKILLWLLGTWWRSWLRHCATSRKVAGSFSDGRPARPRPTALPSPSSDGKAEAATAVVIAPDDGHEDARNILSCI